MTARDCAGGRALRFQGGRARHGANHFNSVVDRERLPPSGAAPAVAPKVVALTSIR